MYANNSQNNVFISFFPQIYYSCCVLLAHWTPFDEKEVPRERVQRWASPRSVIDSHLSHPKGTEVREKQLFGYRTSETDRVKVSEQLQNEESVSLRNKFSSKKMESCEESTCELVASCSYCLCINVNGFKSRENRSGEGDYLCNKVLNKTLTQLVRKLSKSKDISVKLWKTRKKKKKRKKNNSKGFLYTSENSISCNEKTSLSSTKGKCYGPLLDFLAKYTREDNISHNKGKGAPRQNTLSNKIIKHEKASHLNRPKGHPKQRNLSLSDASVLQEQQIWTQMQRKISLPHGASSPFSGSGEGANLMSPGHNLDKELLLRLAGIVGQGRRPSAPPRQGGGPLRRVLPMERGRREAGEGLGANKKLKAFCLDDLVAQCISNKSSDKLRRSFHVRKNFTCAFKIVVIRLYRNDLTLLDGIEKNLRPVVLIATHRLSPSLEQQHSSNNNNNKVRDAYVSQKNKVRAITESLGRENLLPRIYDRKGRKFDCWYRCCDFGPASQLTAPDQKYPLTSASDCNAFQKLCRGRVCIFFLIPDCKTEEQVSTREDLKGEKKVLKDSECSKLMCCYLQKQVFERHCSGLQFEVFCKLLFQIGKSVANKIDSNCHLEQAFSLPQQKGCLSCQHSSCASGGGGEDLPTAAALEANQVPMIAFPVPHESAIKTGGPFQIFSFSFLALAILSVIISCFCY